MKKHFMLKKKKTIDVAMIAIIVFGSSLLVDDQQSFVFATVTNTQAVSTGTLLTSKVKWNLSEIYKDHSYFETEIRFIKTVLLPRLSEYQDVLSQPQKFKEFLLLDEQIKRRISTAYCYAVLDRDLNQRKLDETELVKVVDELYDEYIGAIYFVDNEVRTITKETLNEVLANTELTEYRRYFEKLHEQNSHALSADEEMRLAQMKVTFGEPGELFNKITISEYKKPIIKTADGKSLTLSDSIYNACETSRDRELRRAAYEAMLTSYKKQVNSLATNYANQLALDNFSAKSRKYNSALEAALSEKEITLESYVKLVDSVNGNLKDLHRYYEIRKNYLGLERMYVYDLLVPIVEDINYRFSYESAVRVMNNALVPLGPSYLTDLNSGLNSNWLNVPPQKSDLKSNYLWNVYAVHPFIMLNYNDRLEDVLNLNGIMGCALNHNYSNQSQNYLYADVSDATEQVAAYVNNLLIMKYFIEHSKTDHQKLFFIQYQIQYIKNILFDNVLEAEFEQTAHELASSSDHLSADELNTIWLNLLKKYGGDALSVPEECQYTWSRVEEFYTPNDSYLPALNLSAAYKIVNELSSSNSKDYSEKYMEYLKAGDSLKPLDSLKLAGVDLESSETTESILNYFRALVDEYQRLLMANNTANKIYK